MKGTKWVLEAIATMLVMTLFAAPAVARGKDPFQGRTLYLNPDADACKQAEIWRSSRPDDAAQMDKICLEPTSKWFGEWTSKVRSAVHTYVARARRTGSVPVVVSYDQYQLGADRHGGASSPRAYRRWIDHFAKGIEGRRSVVILEPDALPQLSLLNRADRHTRLRLLHYGIRKLDRGRVSVYLTVGSSGWQPVGKISRWMRRAGINGATGFALNVAGFEWTHDEIAYGNAISRRVGGSHFVVGTSRNGLGPGSTWCNPSGRALGPRPTSQTGHPRVDAFLWIKYPGHSDGACNGGPSSGFWPDYALGLAQRAAY